MLLHTEAFTHRSFDAQMLLHTHTLALFLSRPRSATTPKAHIKCLYAPNGYGRRACRRQLNIYIYQIICENIVRHAFGILNEHALSENTLYPVKLNHITPYRIIVYYLKRYD
jgi:hypothetical protein